VILVAVALVAAAAGPGVANIPAAGGITSGRGPSPSSATSRAAGRLTWSIAATRSPNSPAGRAPISPRAGTLHAGTLHAGTPPREGPAVPRAGLHSASRRGRARPAEHRRGRSSSG